MSNCELLLRITVSKACAMPLARRLLFVTAALVSVAICAALPVSAESLSAKEKPLYIGDFDGPSERNEYSPPGLNRGAFYRPLGGGPAGRPTKIIHAREKGFVDFLKVEKNSKGQLFIKSDDKKVFLLKLSEAQVRFFFGTPNIVKKYDKRVKTAKLDQVFEYVCYNDDVLSKLSIGFEKKVVCRAVVKHWDATMGTPGLGNGHTQKDL